jgi:hypothetical protein
MSNYDELYRINVAHFRAQFSDPCIQRVWDDIDPNELIEAFYRVYDNALSIKIMDEHLTEHPAKSFLEHLAKLLYFFYHGVDEPIEIDVGIPSMNYCPAWCIQDGNHRFMAAVLRGDTHIIASVSGCVTTIESLTD